MSTKKNDSGSSSLPGHNFHREFMEIPQKKPENVTRRKTDHQKKEDAGGKDAGPEIDTSAKDSIDSWKDFKDKFIGKTVFIKE